MQYFRHQLEARRLSRRLVLLFAVGVVCVTTAVSAVLLTLAATLSNGLIFFRLPDGPWLQQHPAAVIGTAVLVLGILAMAVLLKRIELRDGGGAVARSLGGERIDAGSRDPLQRRLHNVVEEMAIAAGVALPEVYVLTREPGINAFASGLTPANSAIAVTRGALEKLRRDELQGVIAHEFSHIVNNDIRLNLHLVGWLHGLMALSVMARGILKFAPRDSRGRRTGLPAVFIAAFAVMALGYVGWLFGRLMQAAVARRREALADASAVQFTRNPDGLRGALLKIAASSAQLQEVNTDEVAHMLFVAPGSQWFATHPPIEARISALGAPFDSSELKRVHLQLQQGEAALGVEPEPQRATAQLTPFLTNVTLTPAQIVASVGNSDIQHLRLARQLRISLPATVMAAAAQSDAALALFFALAINGATALREKQLDYLRHCMGKELAGRVAALLDTIDHLNVLQRQPALLCTLPQLRQLPASTRSAVAGCLNGLLPPPAQLTVAQYALRKLAQVQLHDAGSRAARVFALNLQQAAESLQHLLAVLAQQGHAETQSARQAYDRAMQHLNLRRYAEYKRYENWPSLLDVALLRLDRLQPVGKQMLIEAMLIAVSHDQQVTVEEAELLRAFCACLHCPVPPLLDTNVSI